MLFEIYILFEREEVCYEVLIKMDYVSMGIKWLCGQSRLL